MAKKHNTIQRKRCGKSNTRKRCGKSNTRKKLRKTQRIGKKTWRYFGNSLSRTLKKKNANKWRGGGGEGDEEDNNLRKRKATDQLTAVITSQEVDAAIEAAKAAELLEYNTLTNIEVNHTRPHYTLTNGNNDIFNTNATRIFRHHAELGTDNICSICHNLLKNNQIVLQHVLPNTHSQHGYHYNCIIEWILGSLNRPGGNNCPQCGNGNNIVNSGAINRARALHSRPPPSISPAELQARRNARTNAINEDAEARAYYAETSSSDDSNDFDNDDVSYWDNNDDGEDRSIGDDIDYGEEGSMIGR